MGSSTRKVMFHPNVIGKFEELAVLVAVPTRQPARLRRVQNQASGMQRMTSSEEMSP